MGDNIVTVGVTEDQVRKLVDQGAKAAVREVLLRLGIDTTDDFTETREALHYARKLRRASQTVSKASIWSAVGIIVAAVLGAFWVGFQTFFNQGGQPPIH